ncbi:Uncharacterised protein [Vibrio cholerae]|nr:Uncharacterised protein [Vibrio cholerae]
MIPKVAMLARKAYCMCSSASKRSDFNCCQS